MAEPPDKDDADKRFFREAMRKVKPLTNSNARSISNKPRSPIKFARPAQLSAPYSDPLSAELPAPTLKAEDHVCYFTSGLSMRQQRELRRGNLFLQARLDLHGFPIDKARTALYHFIINCQENQYRYVLIIHGKGRDPENKACLKNAVIHWLKQLPVLAWCSAKPSDGGTGALYVLINRKI